MEPLARHFGAIILCLPVLIVSGAAQAQLIDFEDILPYTYELPDGSLAMTDTPDFSLDGFYDPTGITTQYSHLGVVFGGYDGAPATDSAGMIYPDASIEDRPDAAVSGSQSLGHHYSPDGFSFHFIAELPDYVSFFVTGSAGVASITTHFADGSETELDLGFELTADGPLYSSEKLLRRKIELFGGQIESVAISNFFGHRSVQVYIDDLSFSRNVPEPNTLALMVGSLGLLGGLSLRRRRT